MPSVDIGGTIIPTGDVVEFLIEMDNPGGTITPFGSLQWLVDFGVIGEEIAGVITPTGELTLEVSVECFDTEFECVEVPETDYNCVAVCEDRVVPPSPPPMYFSGVIPLVGTLQVPAAPCPECPECPEPCGPPCPEQTTGNHLAQSGVHDGDIFIGTVDVIGATPSPSTTAWKATVTTAGLFGNTWKEKVDFGTGGGSGPLLVTQHIRSSFAASFAGVGHSVTIYRAFGGYTAGQNVEVSIPYVHQDVFGVKSYGVQSYVYVADGSGQIVVAFTWTENFTGILLSEHYWLEDVIIRDTEFPCP